MNFDERLEFAAKLLNISVDEAKESAHEPEGVDALYVCVLEKGGGAILVSPNGEVLYANSSVEYEDHIEEFKKGRRTPLEAFDQQSGDESQG